MAVEKMATPFLPPDAEVEGIEIEIMEDLPEDEFFGEELLVEEEIAFDANLAEHMEEYDLVALSSKLVSGYEGDRSSRSEWEKTYVKGLDLLGLRFENRSEPWEGASGVFHPLLSEAVIRFQSQTIQEIFPASGPVKTTLVGKESPERLRQAGRVKDYLNYTATRKMVEYRTETEKLLFTLCVAGSSFRKVYFDPTLGRPSAMFVPPEDLVVSYGASDLATAPRVTHVMRRTPNEVRKMQRSGWYIDCDLEDPQPDPDEIAKKIASITGEEENYEFDGRHALLEMQVEIDLEGFEDVDEDGEPTGIELPYIVTLDKSSRKILGIRRNWLEEDEIKSTREYYVHYQYLPGLGFYGFGLVHMIGGLSKAATSILRQLIDAGTLSNLPGGLKTRGLRIKGDDTPIAPGEYRDVDVPAGSIRDNITFLPYKEPSGVLYQLLTDLVQEGRRFASAADVKASDINGEAPVGTTLAVLEREMKVMSAIQARVHAAMGREINLLSEIVRDYGPEEYPYEVDEGATISSDFDDRVDVIPVSDPNAGTMAQRIMQYQAALQLSASAPQLYDMQFLHRQMLEVLGIQEAERIVPLEDDMRPLDPVSENMAILGGKPVKTFDYQDHEAHIQTHMSMLENPEVLQMMEKSPQAQAVSAAMASHISEHVALAYRDKVEKELGVELPPAGEPMPEDIEYRLSKLVAQASAQVTGKAQRMQKAEEDAQKQEDPIVQQRERELALEEQKANDKRQEAAQRIMTEMERIDSQERIATARLGRDIAKDQLDAQIDAENVRHQEALRGFEIGLDIARDMTDNNEIDGSNG